MNLENIRISLGTLIKIGVPSFGALFALTGAYYGYDSHVKSEAEHHKDISRRMTGIECALGLKTGYECQVAALAPMFDMIAPSAGYAASADAMAMEDVEPGDIVLEAEPQR